MVQATSHSEKIGPFTRTKNLSLAKHMKQMKHRTQDLVMSLCYLRNSANSSFIVCAVSVEVKEAKWNGILPLSIYMYRWTPLYSLYHKHVSLLQLLA